MAGDVWLQALRRAVHGSGGDFEVVEAAVRVGFCLQLAGDAVRVAVRSRRPGVEMLATGCVSALRERGWNGDLELADAIQDELAGRPASGLRELAVDLEELAGVLDAGGPEAAGGRIDLSTGQVWPESPYDDSWDESEEDLEDEERWLWVSPLGSRPGYEDMVEFAASRSEPLAGRLERVLHGPSVFRRFKDVLFDCPEDREEWFAFSEDRQRGRARAWLADAGIRPVIHSVIQPSG